MTTTPDPKDEAITELAHVARNLQKALREAGVLPGAFDQALTNKIDHYAAAASATPAGRS